MTGERYVSLVPSLTEALFELGVGEEVVGVTRFCVHPAAKVQVITKVGGTKDPNIERILDLKPTLVLVNQEENRLEDVEALRRHGLEVLVTFPRKVAAVPGMLRAVGERVGRPERAEVLAAEVEQAVSEVRSEAARRSPVTFAVLVWRKPWIAAGPGTFLSDLLTTAGGVNLIEDSGESLRYPEVTLEELARLSPDRVLLPSEPFPFQNRHRDELVNRTRMGDSAFLRCDGELLTWHGPRTAAGLRAAARWLQGFDQAPRAKGAASSPPTH